MSAIKELKKHLRPGQVYRRGDLSQFSNAVDRHLHQLVKDGVLQKLAGGLYYCPKQTSFGKAPPDDQKLVRAFLKDEHFYITSPNAYNSLGVGASQLYNERFVYNHKRDGRYVLNGRHFYFIKRARFPKKSSVEFLLVDLINNLQFLAEDREKLRENVKKKALDMDKKKLMKMVSNYAGARTKNFFEGVLHGVGVSHAH
ncbi:MAG: hypothetical protein H6936_01355 [Burkholderiales bacterium]|nr:hypothetical protein [Nitrosomonas sp.]MCP5273502.1 hypothetical protein [Burkholderiales bacterium]